MQENPQSIAWIRFHSRIFAAAIVLPQYAKPGTFVETRR
jgi:hypothetical protein